MARWECIVCGLIYDEKEGWPEDGIAPGTKWEDVPDDWTCPDCGVGKEDFELIPGSDDGEAPADDAAPAAADDAVARSIVVIGSGLAGYGLVRELRRKDDAVAITVLTADGGEGYSKPMISTGYTKDLNADKLAAQSAEELAEQLNVIGPHPHAGGQYRYRSASREHRGWRGAALQRTRARAGCRAHSAANLW